MPVTTLVPELIVATDGVLLVHDTPGVAVEFSVVVVPTQTLSTPVIGAAAEVTVTTAVAEHPLPVV
jgi:hypothetical protein